MTHTDIYIRANYILVECYYVGGVQVMQLHDWSEVLINCAYWETFDKIFIRA